MKIGYFADGPWAHKAIEEIVASKSFEIAFIVPRYDTQDVILKEWANELGVPFLPCKNVNDLNFINSLSQYHPDILVSMSFNQILKKEIIEYAPKGFINCHAGALPFYRGRNPLNWALINGAESFGITVHYVDEGIDTGDIVEQRTYPITLTDNYESLLSQAIRECSKVLFSAINKIESGFFERIKQSDIHPIGTYFGIRTEGDENINFSWSALRVHNFIRAIAYPGPGARFLIDVQEYAIESAHLIDHAPNYIATCGEVVGRSAGGVVVKVGDSSIRITSIRRVEENIKFTPQFKIGTRLKNK